MEKFIIYETQHLNFIIIKVDADPEYDLNNQITNYKIKFGINGKNQVPGHVKIGHIPNYINAANVFDDYAAAEQYINNNLSQYKIRKIDVLNKEIYKLHQKIDLIKAKCPSVKKLNCIKHG